MPESPEKTSVSPGRRWEILESAERVFARAGYRGTTMADVAQEVGFTQPALYRYFSSKRELFTAALALRQQEIIERYGAALRGDGRASGKIRALVETTLDLALDHPEMAQLRLQAIGLAEEADIRERVAATITGLREAHTALFTKAREEGDLASGMEPSTAANALGGMALLLYANLALGLPDADRKRAHEGARNFLDTILDGT